MKRKPLVLAVILMLAIGYPYQAIRGQTKPNPPQKLYGLNFGPYLDGQNPHLNPQISQAQLQARLKIIAPYTEWIRTFNCTNGMEQAVPLAHRFGLKIAVGAWLDKDSRANEREIESLIKIGKSGAADVLIVGNEVLFHKTVTEEQLIKYLQLVKREVPDIPVTTVEIYNEMLRRSKVGALCDVIMINCYPFWEKQDIHLALPEYQLVYKQVRSKYAGKPVVFAEVGWPSGGKNFGPAFPSLVNAEMFFRDFTAWAALNKVPYFYFEAFDESWKATDEPGVGAYWGIWDKDGRPKWDMSSFRKQ